METLSIPKYALKSICGLPALTPLALFVVTKITPLAARDPYKEAEAASFNTVIFSISSGLMDAKPEVVGKPSITTNGSFPPLIEAAPRTRITKPPFGSPLAWLICTPENFPCNFSPIRETGISDSSLASSLLIDPVTERAF